MARPAALAEGVTHTPTFGLVRTVTAVIAADNSSLIDANFPLASAINCSEYDTVFIGVEIDGGTNPTVTIEPLFRDSDAVDGSRWRRIKMGAPLGVTPASAAIQTTGALAPGDFVEIRVNGHPAVWFRTTAVANPTSTTELRVLMRPGLVRPRPLRR